jgi:deoxyribodipyrimidine photolyase-related protein
MAEYNRIFILKGDLPVADTMAPRTGERVPMSFFLQELIKCQPGPQGRRWIYVPYDQITDRIGPLSRENPNLLGIVLVENPWKASRRPYHKQKLALILANLRHFALEQARRGVAVRHVVTQGPYRTALAPLIKDLGPLQVMEPAERELRSDLEPLVLEKSIVSIPHEGWLTTRQQFFSGTGQEPPWRMDSFYRHIRRETGILMKGGKPETGRVSFDQENRLAWRGDPPAPDSPSFPRDPIKEEVGQLIEKIFPYHPGRLDLDHLPGTAGDAERLWEWAKKNCLPFFGPYEDAMSTRSTGLFHTRLSALINIHRLIPANILKEAEKIKIPLPSKEGFIRQILGWREFVRHVHSATDGFRILPKGDPPRAEVPGDGGYRRWSGKPWPSSAAFRDPDGGAEPNGLNCQADLPPAYWGKESGLACLDRVVGQVWAEGYSHHITRLMILANLAALLDVRPREITDWFWAAYTDAYDWVVEPNVLAMGTFAVGDFMTTKPYVAGAAYINRMSDFCGDCRFDPKKNCPITSLYWAFLSRHKTLLKRNPRMAMSMRALAKRELDLQKKDRAVFDSLQRILDAGKTVSPEDLP